MIPRPPFPAKFCDVVDDGKEDPKDVVLPWNDVVELVKVLDGAKRKLKEALSRSLRT